MDLLLGQKSLFWSGKHLTILWNFTLDFLKVGSLKKICFLKPKKDLIDSVLFLGPNSMLGTIVIGTPQTPAFGKKRDIDYLLDPELQSYATFPDDCFDSKQVSLTSVLLQIFLFLSVNWNSNLNPSFCSFVLIILESISFVHFSFSIHSNCFRSKTQGPSLQSTTSTHPIHQLLVSHHFVILFIFSMKNLIVVQVHNEERDETI